MYLLRVARVRVQDNFFALGGHSLLATQLFSRLRKAFTVDLPLRLLFEAPTVAGLGSAIDGLQAKQVGEAQAAEMPSIPLVERTEAMPLSFAQQRMWFLYQLEGGAASTYNVSFGWRIEGELNRPALRQSLHALINRHEPLRTTFATLENQPVTRIAQSACPHMVTHDLSHLPAESAMNACMRLVNTEAQRPFDLVNGPLLRTLLVQLGEQSHVLFVNLHHIACDGWSLGVLMRGLVALYTACLPHSPHEVCKPLPALPIQ